MQVGDDCWEWQGKRSNGYGYFSLNGKYVKAARFAYEMFIGPIPEGLQLDHLCRNRACCKPWHLEPVTNRVNGLRGVSPCAVNVAKTECPKGHPYDAANTVIAANGWRKCRECNRIAMRARQARKVASRSAGR
ncbi:MAG TPA: HNH endonuclease signature motif containing protein [Acidobacteriaceae bacterium]